MQNFTWHHSYYDGVVGVFCLCYLEVVEIRNLLAGMWASLKDYGHIILMEPVLELCSEHD